jgi:hypothetical protein
MTKREHAAYHAGLRQAADMALVAALTLEMRADGAEIRQRAAIEALRGLAEGLKAEAHSATSVPATIALMTAIAKDPGTTGTSPCPECSGYLHWMKDSSNGHIHAACEDPDCLRVMQ